MEYIAIVYTDNHLQCSGHHNHSYTELITFPRTYIFEAHGIYNKEKDILLTGLH
jgi:hypothetical protein